VAFAPGGDTLVVSDRTAGLLYVVDVEAGEVARSIPLRGAPMAVAWGKGSRVYVSEYDNGTVAEVQTRTGKVLRRFAVGPKPVGVAFAAKKKLLVVSNYGLNNVSIVDVTSGKERGHIAAGPRPYFAAVTPDETMAVVGNLLPAGPATDPRSAAVVSLIDLDKTQKIRDIVLPDSSSCVRKVAISPGGRWAYVTHTRGRTTLPTTQLERGWVNTNALSDPWGIALAADASTAWISIAGTHQIARIELARLHDFMAGRGDIKSLGLSDSYASPAAIWQQIKEEPAKRDQLSYHLSALYAADLLSRIQIPAQCPRGIALAPDGKCLAVASYYTGEVLLLDPDRCRVIKAIDLGPQPEPDEVRHGEFVFHNGYHSFQHWLSCATCHPDGRADAMNWDLLNDGIGNPKNAKSLLWSHKTPPAMALGVRASMEEAAREVEEGDLKAVQAYLRSMQPERSPHLVNGRLSEKALRGKALFESDAVGCSHCHPGPLYTSMEPHDVSTSWTANPLSTRRRASNCGGPARTCTTAAP